MTKDEDDVELTKDEGNVELMKDEGDVELKANVESDDNNIDGSDTESDNTVILSEYIKQKNAQNGKVKVEKGSGIPLTAADIKPEPLITFEKNILKKIRPVNSRQDNRGN